MIFTKSTHVYIPNCLQEEDAGFCHISVYILNKIVIVVSGAVEFYCYHYLALFMF